MSLLSGLFGVLAGRIDHVPEKDVQEVLDTANELRDPRKAPFDEEDLRAFESAQVLYTTGRIVRQVTPRAAQPAVQAALAGLPGVADVPQTEPAPAFTTGGMELQTPDGGA